MNIRLLKELLRGLPLQAIDTARLVMECVEGLGNQAAGKGRDELICLVRRAMVAGIAAIQAEERTESFEKVAWESVAARSNRRPTTTRDLRHYVRRMLRVEGDEEKFNATP